jgi:hypothetical protein
MNRRDTFSPSWFRYAKLSSLLTEAELVGTNFTRRAADFVMISFLTTSNLLVSAACRLMSTKVNGVALGTKVGD